MRVLIQRVIQSQVVVGEEIVAEIEQGLLAFIGFEVDDSEAKMIRMLNKLLNYRIFEDDKGRMNLSLADTHQGLLLVPQFTLAADTQKGARPSFNPAMLPEQAEPMFLKLVQMAKARYQMVTAGVFGAYMEVSLINDGPVTFLLEV